MSKIILLITDWELKEFCTVGNICSLGIFICLASILIIFIRTANEVDKEFEAWLSENATKDPHGHYTYNQDKGRIYSREQLRSFFNQSETKP